MKIDGKAIAQHILDDLTKRIHTLKERGVTPHLVIILVGNDPASEAYVKQKVLKGETIGAKVTVTRFPINIHQYELLATIKQYNNDNNVHALIVQQPLPAHIDVAAITQATDPKKDVDGFHKDSPFSMPLANAVVKILEEVYKSKTGQVESTFEKWLASQNIVVMGKGKTGGGPVISKLQNMHIEPRVIDSKTENPKKVMKEADIVVATVGKIGVITPDMLKKDVVLVGVGMSKGEDGKLYPDYDETAVEDIADWYTPVPGGVGPVNVAMLLENVVTAAQKQA